MRARPPGGLLAIAIRAALAPFPRWFMVIPGRVFRFLPISALGEIMQRNGSRSWVVTMGTGGRASLVTGSRRYSESIINVITILTQSYAQMISGCSRWDRVSPRARQGQTNADWFVITLRYRENLRLYCKTSFEITAWAAYSSWQDPRNWQPYKPSVTSSLELRYSMK